MTLKSEGMVDNFLFDANVPDEALAGELPLLIDRLCEDEEVLHANIKEVFIRN